MRLLAQDINLIDPASRYNRVFYLEPGDYVIAFVNIALGLAGIVSFLLLLSGGVQWVSAGSDKDALDRARRRMLNALIGLVIVFSLYTLMFIINTLFGVDLLNFNIPQIT